MDRRWVADMQARHARGDLAPPRDPAPELAAGDRFVVRRSAPQDPDDLLSVCGILTALVAAALTWAIIGSVALLVMVLSGWRPW